MRKLDNVVCEDERMFVMFDECSCECMHTGCDVVVVCLFCSTMIPGNNVGPEGAKALAPALGQLRQLARLYMRGE